MHNWLSLCRSMCIQILFISMIELNLVIAQAWFIKENSEVEYS